ncbi:HAD family phosphatase [Caldilinea sp.]|uniref:HAD family hydrolase n=1 Tax=Caldilinea sp. TaxID=2293560 RepID=UPI002D176CB8|nr:HAD family phosphatase [Anaerolineales bacterium]HQY90379.1 HAD family phosphatase [Caldilinea sp.]HRA65389.1 HAD family phosphatase [Caldilinea sp.]
MQAILFDIGNVLVWYHHSRTLEAVALLYGVDPARVSALYAKISQAFGLGEITPEQVRALLNEQFDADVSLEQFEQAFSAGITRNEDALSYAAGLQVDGELLIGAISNTNASHVAWLDVHIPELKQFELVIMSNEVGLLKPNPDIFELALELLNLSAGQVLYIDDSAENVATAHQLGMKSFTHIDWEQTRARIADWRTTSSVAVAG